MFITLDMSAFKVDCALGSNSPLAMYGVWLILPILFGASLAAWWIVTRIFFLFVVAVLNVTRPHANQKPADHEGLARHVVYKASRWATEPPFDLYVCLNAWMSIMATFYIIIVNNSIAMFSCVKHPNGMHTTRRWNSLLCYSVSRLTRGSISFPVRPSRVWIGAND